MLRKVLHIFLALLLFPSPLHSQKVDFEKDILPALEVSCFKCHSERLKKPKGKLKLDSKEAFLETIEDVPLFTPGDSSESYLLEVLHLPKDDDEAMPPASKAPTVSPVAIAKIKQWIDEGADFGDWEKFEHPVVDRGSSGLTEISKTIPSEITTAAAEIDRIVKAANPAAYESPLLDDATFLRRTYLLIAGRAPTRAEAMDALARKDYRPALVASLLASPAHVSHQFNYWANVLRATSTQYGNLKNSWLVYLKQSLAENKPYDVWAREMLSASGYTFENPAIGLHVKDSKNRLAGYEANVAVFLGTQIGCAQCHDHPYDTISRRNYYEMNGYFSQTHGGVGQSKNRFFKNISWKEADAVDREIAKAAKKGGIFSKEFDKRVASHQIFGHDQGFGSLSLNLQGTFGSHLPADYQYDDGKPGAHVEPAPVFGKIPELHAGLSEGDRPMDIFAAWTTDPENLKFSHVIANRLWDQVFGYTVMGNLTEIVEPAHSTNPELSRFLAGLIVRLDYDMRKFLQVLYSTDLYQREATLPDDAPALSTPHLRRASAEQVWDSLMTLGKPGIDSGLTDFEKPDWSYVTSAREVKSPAELEALILARSKTFGDRQKQMKEKQREQRARQRDGFNRDDLRRASELPQPAPAGHFLSLFGQAPRETIEDQWANPTTPQALTLLNGPILEIIVSPGSPLHQAWKNSPEKIQTIYQTILSRNPTAEETALIEASLAPTTPQGLTDLTWSLLNSREFIFIR